MLSNCVLNKTLTGLHFKYMNLKKIFFIYFSNNCHNFLNFSKLHSAYPMHIPQIGVCRSEIFRQFFQMFKCVKIEP